LIKKAKLDFDRKKHNYVLKKKTKKKEAFMEHRTHANPPPKAHPQRLERRRGMRKYKRSQK
jgi:hypothetical protein